MVEYYGQPQDQVLSLQQQQQLHQQQHYAQKQQQLIQQQQQQLQSQLNASNRHTAHTSTQKTDLAPSEEIHLNDIKRMKSTHMNRKITNSHRVGKRSTLMETPSPNTAFASNKSDDGGNSRPQSIGTDISNGQIKRTSQYNELGGELSQLSISSHNTSNHNGIHNYTKSIPKARSFYFAELGALQHFMLKHIAVLYLEEILHDHFTLEELADLIDDKKNSTLWGKFVTSLKAGGNKKAPRPKG